MKKIIKRAVPCLLFALTFLAGNAQNTKGYTITGHINGLNDGEKVVMRMTTALNFKFQDWDSTVVKNGSFFFKGTVPNGPRTFWMHLGEKHFKVIILVVDNGENITINSDKNYLDIPHGFLESWVDIQGAKSHAAEMTIGRAYQLYVQTVQIIDHRIKKVVDSVGFDPNICNELFTLKKDVIDDFYTVFLQKPDDDYRLAVPDVAEALFDRSGRAAFWKAVYDSLDNHLKESFAAKKWKEKIPLSIGQPFPLFSLPGTDGKMIALKDVMTKSKVTLVEFFASGSFNVENFQKELLLAYNKYHTKGLNIIGMSSDTSAKKWKIAVSDLPWPTVSDLKGEQGTVGAVYHEYGEHGTPQQNTTNVLIGADGKIIAWDVSGPELQWYLWKELGN
jgi:peroxiredoxin